MRFSLSFTTALIVMSIVAPMALAGEDDPPPSPAESYAAREAAVDALIEFLAGEPVDCPDDVSRVGRASGARCAIVQIEYAKFPRKLRKALKKVVRGSDEMWDKFPEILQIESDEGTLVHRALIGIHGRPYTVWYAGEGGGLAFAPAYPCVGDPDLWERTDALVDPRYTSPALKERVKPSWPSRAKAEMVSGRAIIQAVIEADGTVGETCVVYADPQERGFETAGVDAITQWVYEPARRDGQPQSVFMTIAMTWEFY
jgi:TonB family protein